MTDDMASSKAQIEKPKRPRTSPRMLISAAVFGAAFALIFVNQALGLNLTILILLIYAYAALNSKPAMARRYRDEKLLYLFTFPAVLLSLTFFLTDSCVNIFNFLAIFAVMITQYTVLSGNALNRWDESGFILDVFFSAINRFLFGSLRFVGDGVTTLFGGKKKAGMLAGIAAGLALLMIVVPLLVSADAYVSLAVGNLIDSLALGDIFLYVLMFLIGASLIMAPFSTASEPEATGPRRAVHFFRRPIQPVTAGIALLMVSVVYVLFAVVQFGYFFVPRETIASVLGLTSSAYAVRGFGEMMTVTCLNFGLIILGLCFVQQKNGKTPPYLKALYVLLIAFNFVMLASAHLRMECYISAYGASVARFLAHSFMLLLAALNAMMLARIFSDKVKLVRLFASAALIYLCALSAVNPERAVAKENFARYERTGKIDTAYMLALPGDALAETCDFLEAHPVVFDGEARSAAQSRLEEMEGRYTGWPSLNLAEERAKEKLKALLSH